MSEAKPPPATATGIYSHADFQVGTVLADRFRVESMLGVGGMGVVYLATDLALDVPVALKLLRPELASRTGAFERFRQELLLARQVSSPHVVRIHDLAKHEDRWLISMDYVEGESLDRRMDRDGPMEVEEALRIARQIAEGLGAAHAKGVVHRDLKPANILLDKEGNAYVSDFGVARSLASTGVTQSGTVVGTPEYLSPEQARGDTIDARSDLYALGLILYEMLAGKPPFSGGTVAEILAQRLVRTPEPLSRHRADAPAWVVRLTDKLLRPQPAHRFRDSAAVIAAIDRRAVARELRLSAVMRVGLAAVLVAGVGVAGWMLQRDAGVAAPVTPPLERMLVLPVTFEGDDEATRDRLFATAAHLREALAAIPGTAVVDGERTALALRLLDSTGSSEFDIPTLRNVAAAQRVLQPRMLEAGGQWHVSAVLHGAGSETKIDGPAAADPVAAMDAWAAAPATAQRLGLAAGSLALRLPESMDALQAYGAGLGALRRDDLSAARTRLEAATTAAPDYAAAWLARADVAQLIGEQDMAFQAIEQGQPAADAGTPRMQRRFAAERLLLEGDATEAAAQWQALLEATPDDTFAELNLARAQGAAGDFPSAVAGLQKLTSRDGQDPRAWFELGKFSILSGDARRAVDDHLVRALVLYKRSDNRFGEAEAVNALGIGYARLGQTSDAIEQYRKAVELRRAVGNRRGEATSLRNLGTMLTFAGKFDEAASVLADARTLHASLDDRAGLAAVENELGLLAEEQGDYPGALEAYRRALQAWQQLNDAPGVAQALNDIGFAYFQLGAYDNAQVYLQQAANDYAKLGDQTGTIRTDQGLGLLAIARGRWEKARRLLEHSLAEADRQQMLEEAAVSHRHIAELELLQGRPVLAIAAATKAEALFQQREDAHGRADAALIRIQALLAMHADEAAREALDALSATLADASREQQAIAALLRAQLARMGGDVAKDREWLAQARGLAAAAGIKSLQLQADLQAADARGAAALKGDILRLGNATLRLRWLEKTMVDALAAGKVQAAVDAYRDVQPTLRSGAYLRARDLHSLGALALARAGDAAGAAAADAASARALVQLRAQVPADRLAAFDTAESARGMAVADAR